MEVEDVHVQADGCIVGGGGSGSGDSGSGRGRCRIEGLSESTMAKNIT